MEKIKQINKKLDKLGMDEVEYKRNLSLELENRISEFIEGCDKLLEMGITIGHFDVFEKQDFKKDIKNKLMKMINYWVENEV